MPTGRPLAGAALHSHLTKTCPAPPAPKGNQRAAKHGAKSLHKLGPARERHMKALRVDYPNLDNRRLALLADRLARIDLASSWLDKQKGIVHSEDGGVFHIAKEVEKWASRAEVLLERAEAEGRRKPRRDLALEMSAMEDGD